MSQLTTVCELQGFQFSPCFELQWSRAHFDERCTKVFAKCLGSVWIGRSGKQGRRLRLTHQLAEFGRLLCERVSFRAF